MEAVKADLKKLFSKIPVADRETRSACCAGLIYAADPETDERDLLIVLLHTLARIDEALRKKWEDIDFHKKSLIKRTRKTKDGSYKTIKIAINNELYDTLMDMWEKTGPGYLAIL